MTTQQAREIVRGALGGMGAACAIISAKGASLAMDTGQWQLVALFAFFALIHCNLVAAAFESPRPQVKDEG